MSQNSSPNNVPSAKQGTADSVAAPGRNARSAEGVPACGEGSARSAARFIPVGNHGDISATGRNV